MYVCVCVCMIHAQLLLSRFNCLLLVAVVFVIAYCCATRNTFSHLLRCFSIFFLYIFFVLASPLILRAYSNDSGFNVIAFVVHNARFVVVVIMLVAAAEIAATAIVFVVASKCFG